MSLIDDIKRDRERGTCCAVAEEGTYYSYSPAQIAADRARRNRVPTLENQVLRDAEIKAAAEELAEAAEWAIDVLSICEDPDWRDDEERMEAMRAAYLKNRVSKKAALSAYRKATEGEG